MAENEEIQFNDIFSVTPEGSLALRVTALEESMVGHSHNGRTSSTIRSTMYSPNFQSGVEGWMIQDNGDVEFNNGVFRGAIVGASIDIGGSDSTSFHVDIDGNMWLGSGTFGGAPFRVNSTGALTATNATLSGSLVATSLTASVGSIGGWIITGSTLFSSGGGVILDSTGSVTTSGSSGQKVVMSGISNTLTFFDSSSNARAKFDGTGLVLLNSIGSTSTIINTDANGLTLSGAGGTVFIGNSGSEQLTATTVYCISDLVVDVEITPGLTTAKIGSSGNEFLETHTDKVLGNSGGNVIDFSSPGQIKTNQSFRPAVDNTIALGSGALRWSAVNVVTKPSILDHPTDDAKRIRYWAMEGSDCWFVMAGSKTYTGIVGDEIVIDLPAHYAMTTESGGCMAFLQPIDSTLRISVVSCDNVNLKVRLHDTGTITFSYIVYAPRKNYPYGQDPIVNKDSI